jgi:hypothetical protein
MNKYMKSTHTRIEMLERQNRWLTIIAIATIIALLIAATGGPAVIRAASIQLADEEDNVRAELSLKNKAVGLCLMDEDGNDRLRATYDAESAGLYVNDDRGTTRIGIAQFARRGGGIALHGAESKGAAVLYLKDQGSLRFFDADGNVTNQVVASTADD